MASLAYDHQPLIVLYVSLTWMCPSVLVTWDEWLSVCLLCACQESLEKAQLHALHGDQLIQSNHYAVDSIRPKCVELRRICDNFTNEAKKKYDILSKSNQIHKGIDKVRCITEEAPHPYISDRKDTGLLEKLFAWSIASFTLSLIDSNNTVWNQI